MAHNNPALSEQEEEKQLLARNGCFRKNVIQQTLQGQLFIAANLKDQTQLYHIKKTSKALHYAGVTILRSGKRIRVNENIVREASILQILHRNAPPESLIKCYAFLQDSHSFYLVMESGGLDFFDFVVRSHELITQGKLGIYEWRKRVKYMFAQIVGLVRWLHEDMRCCHLDISLESMSINSKDNTGIKLVEFGISEFFGPNNAHFQCNKYGGKTHYKAPKVYAKQEFFDARKADIWALGVCLFMMLIGAPPYNKPIDSDVTYLYVKNRQIRLLLHHWGRMTYVTVNALDLLTKMLCVNENKRISINEIVRHPWVRQHFPNEKPQMYGNLHPKL